MEFKNKQKSGSPEVGKVGKMTCAWEAGYASALVGVVTNTLYYAAGFTVGCIMLLMTTPTMAGRA